MKYIIALLCLYFVTSALPDGVYELELDQEVDYSLLPDDE